MVEKLKIDNADIGFKNFEGREGPYNKNGDRNFVVFLNENTASELDKEGWNIKWPKPNDQIDPSEDERNPYLQISVSTDKYPAEVYLVNNNVPIRMSGQEVDMLDWSELEHVDLYIRPYEWTMNGKSGIKAYLEVGYFTIVANPFRDKYEH